MAPETATLLRAVADLASYAQGHPTDSTGIRLRAQGRSRAEAAWVAAGSPDLTNAPRPAVIPKGTGHVDEDKDWTPVSILVEVKRATDKALLLDAGDGGFWCPRSIVTGDLDREGDIDTATLPRWVLP